MSDLTHTAPGAEEKLKQIKKLLDDYRLGAIGCYSSANPFQHERMRKAEAELLRYVEQAEAELGRLRAGQQEPKCPECGWRIGSGKNAHGEFFVVCPNPKCRTHLIKPSTLEECAKFFAAPLSSQGTPELCAECGLTRENHDNPKEFIARSQGTEPAPGN